VRSGSASSAATVVRGQLTCPVTRRRWALGSEGLKLCREADDRYWVAVGWNLLAEIALHTGRIARGGGPARTRPWPLRRRPGDGWNEGYALGTRAAIAARRGKLREAEQQATASVAVMRRIDQQWGAARALLGLGDLARFRNHPARRTAGTWRRWPSCGDRRPAGDRSLPGGLGRVAMDLGAIEQAGGT
jgi:hypothetical protein